VCGRPAAAVSPRLNRLRDGIGKLIPRLLAQLHDVALGIEAVEVELAPEFPCGLDRVELAARSADGRIETADARHSKASLTGESPDAGGDR